MNEIPPKARKTIYNSKSNDPGSCGGYRETRTVVTDAGGTSGCGCLRKVNKHILKVSHPVSTKDTLQKHLQSHHYTTHSALKLRKFKIPISCRDECKTSLCKRVRSWLSLTTWRDLPDAFACVRGQENAGPFTKMIQLCAQNQLRRERQPSFLGLGEKARLHLQFHESVSSVCAHLQIR